MNFPQPERHGPNSCWRLHDLVCWEAASRGDPMPPKPRPEDERYLTAKSVAKRYDRSVPTVWRWAAQSREDAA